MNHKQIKKDQKFRLDEIPIEQWVNCFIDKYFYILLLV